ncbi:sigma-70 family RNA polymerase sigma factor [Streptomyces sp. NPDC005963]|uniref:sigma-70 family RNA polymerase sigma factor n=1 Tax=Streptomyces sp. NPDC005963 TaxID=3156721 RepID=UPI0033C3EB28
MPDSAYSFYVTHFPALVSKGVLLSDSVQEAEEAALFACTELMTRWHTIAHPYAWVEETMIRKIVRDRRERVRWRPWRLFESRTDLEIPLPALPSANEHRKVLQMFTALRQLSLREQQVMVLLALYGYERPEIAEILGTSTNKVDRITAQARQKLHFLLAQGPDPVSLGDGLDSPRRDDPLLLLLRKTVESLRLGLKAQQRAERQERPW